MAVDQSPGHIPSRVNSCQEVTVIRIAFVRGCGQSPDDPVREVVAYYLPDGTLITEQDGCANA